VTGLRVVTLVTAALLWACASPAYAAMPLRVVASFTVLADMVRQVGGEHVQVSSLVGPDGDPHAFEPSPDDARRLKSADIVFINGLGLEGWIDRLITASGTRARIVDTSAGIPALVMTERGRRVTDPHAWNSAANGILYVGTIEAALCAVDPAHAASYLAAASRYVGVLRKLDAYVRAQVAAIPKQCRIILTSHDAFGYFSAAYGVRFLSPVGFSTESEPSAGDVARLIRQIRAEHVGSYFFEDSNDPRLVQQIARETGAKPGGKLYVEALSGPDGPAGNYVAMFKWNVHALIAAMKQP
jgi:zinc/manganese transport system substrate-binding protein